MLDNVMDERSENPELSTFLESLRPGQHLSGTIAAIEQFGVFVALDDGPPHPVHPGVGFISVPELSWHRFNAPSDIVHVGQRVSCEFLQFDTHSLEARLSLRAMQPDPFQVFADSAELGMELTGRVTKVVPIGAFVEVADGVEGLVPVGDLVKKPTVLDDVVQVGEELSVVVTAIDREGRRLELTLRHSRSGGL